jgi:drug/metabolite transporter (DMT)-like permease
MSYALGAVFAGASYVVETFGQVAFKEATKDNDAHKSSASKLRNTLSKVKPIAGGIALYAVDACLWTMALIHLPLTIAQPAGSIEFVLVALFSRLFFKEEVTAVRWAGIAMILIGVTLVTI